MTNPSYGTVAPTSRRVVAYIIDTLIAAGIGIILGVVLVIIAVSAGPYEMLGVLVLGLPVVCLLLLGWYVIYTFMQGGKGSIGMRAQKIRLVREDGGAPLGFGRALLRNIIFSLAASIVVGYFTPLFDSSGRLQGWHDKVVHSLMLDSRINPVNAPRLDTVHVPLRPLRTGPTMPGLATPPVPGAPVPGASAPSMPAPSFSAPTTAAPDETVRAADIPARPAPPAPPAPVAPAVPDALAVPAAPTAPAPTPQAAPTPEPHALIAFVPGITQDGPPEHPAPTPSAPVAAPPAPAAPEPDLEVEQASDIADIEDTRISIPGHRLVFTWDDGTKATVSGRTLFGRNPAPEEGATVVSVRDETLSLSKTHFEAAAASSGGWILDRHSTNGTVIVRDGHRIVCAPGEQVHIRLGDAIEIGDRIVTVGGYA